MADDEYLIDLALKFANYGKKTVSPAENLAVSADQEVDKEEGTGSSDEAFNIATHVQETPSPTPLVPDEAQTDQEVDTIAGHVLKKRKTQSSTHLTPEESQDFAVAADQTVKVDEQRTGFLKLVRDRFPPEDDPYKIPDEMYDTVVAFEDGRLEKSDAHEKACILLIGHADVLHKFERFLKHDDEMDEWRDHVRARFMRDLDRFLKECKKTVEKIKEESPLQKLTAQHLDCIERLLGFEDPVETNVLVANLKKDPERSVALARLEKKVEDFERMKDFVADHFDRAVSYAGFHQQ